MIQPGTRVGDRYQIESLIDEGGMARVYRARDLKLNRILALKIIRQEAFSPYVLEEVFGRFELEAAALAKLSHPNIIGIIDYGKHEGIPYVVMAYVEGGNLKKFQGKPLTMEQAARLLIPITRALAYAHRHGFVHRDVKPSNILLTESEEPMLSDFGLVKDLDSKTAEALTITGASIGTPEYMAPEQAIGEKVDGRADVYSLGVVLYELVTGSRPFKAESPVAMVMNQASHPVPDPRKANPSLSENAVQVLNKALAVRAQDRFQTMIEFEVALDKLRGTPGQPGMAVRPQAYDSERTMVTPSRAASMPPPAPATPPPPAHVGGDEFNATVQMPPLRPPVTPPPASPPPAADNMPTLQMGVSSPVSRPRETPPPVSGDMPTMQMGVALPPSEPQHQAAAFPEGSEPTMAMPAYKPPAYAPPTGAPPPAYPPAPGYSPPAEAARPNPGSKRMVFLAGGGIIIVLLVVAAIWGFSNLNKPAAVIQSTATVTSTEAPAAAAPTTKPTNTPALPTATIESVVEVPTDTPPVETPTPLPGSLVQQGAEMILIPASAFAMGCDRTLIHEVCSENEEPVHSVTLDAYYIDKYEVTNALYRTCVQAGICNPPQDIVSFTRNNYYTSQEFDNHPVIYVTWDDANTYCQWRGARLPTEAEWEKAARGNIDQRVYPWGNNPPNCTLANFNPGEHCVRDPQAVGSYPEGASIFGVMDVAGNVSEWVADWFLFNYYASSPAENPLGPASGESRVLRGGSWTNNLNKLQVSNRDSLVPTIASNNIGFRCAWTP